MKKTISDTFPLSAAGCDAASEYIVSLLKSRTKQSSKEIQLLRLSFEEHIINWMDACSEEQRSDMGFQIVHRARFGKLHIDVVPVGSLKLSFDAESASKAEENELGAGDELASTLSGIWHHYTKKGATYLSVELPTGKNRMLITMGIAIASAVIFSLIMRLLPEDVNSVIMECAVDPLSNAYLSVIKALVTPMIFVSIICGILNMGTPEKLGRLGKRLIGSYFLKTLLVGIAAIIPVVLFFGITSGHGSSYELKSLVDMVFGLVTTDIFSPYISGNTIQVAIMALMGGVALLYIRNKTTVIADVVMDLNLIINKLLSVIAGFMSIFVFLCIVQIFNMDSLGSLTTLVEVLVICIASYFIVALVYVIYASVSLKMPFVSVIKAVLPVWVVAFTTASSSASFCLMKDTCENKFGVKNNYTSFGLPLGMTVFKPVSIVSFMMVTAYCFLASGKTITPDNLVMMVIMSWIMCVTAPPIPGGALACYTVLLTQFDLDLSLLSVITAFNILFDMAETGSDMVCNTLELSVRAKHAGYIKQKKSRAN